MTRRVRRPADKEPLLKRLTDVKEGGIFGSQIDAMVFASALGAARNRAVSFDQTLDPMVFELFARRSDIETLFYLLGLHHKKLISVLGDAGADDRVTAFEEFANGGLEILDAEIKRSGARPADAILQLIYQARDSPPTTGDVDLSKVVKDIGL